MIRVEFTHEGKLYKGCLISVLGAGNKVYHLIINKKHYGALSLVEEKDPPHMPHDPATIRYKWRFTSQTGKLDYLESVFVEALKMAQLF